MAILPILAPNLATGQTGCPQRIGYMENGGNCFTSSFLGFYLVSSEPFNPSEIVLDLNGTSGPCNTTFGNTYYHPCDNGSGYYAAIDNSWPYCELVAPSGTITFPNGQVCHYENGVSTVLAECMDFVENCKEPLIDFAKDFVSDPPNCKLWEGPCATQGEIWRTGNVIIGAGASPSAGAPTGGYKLSVKGGITTEMLQICKAEWCDYVFSDTFQLADLEAVNHFIKQQKYLPGCTSNAVIEQAGGFMLDVETVHQQAKIEEIFLHLINAQRRLDQLDGKITTVPYLNTEHTNGQKTYLGEEYPSKTKQPSLTQIECFQIKSAPNGIGGILVSPDSGPYSVIWSGAGNGNMNNVVCNGAIRINNLVAGHYNVTITNAAGLLGTCSFNISSGGETTNCAMFSDPACKAAIVEMLEEDGFGTPPACKQWEGDPCSHEGNIYRLGNVEIGTSVGRGGYSLAVKGSIVTDKFRVELCESNPGWCDYVFDDDYPLPKLYEVESFIATHKHLPGSITQNEVTETGGFEMRSVKLDHQKKIEEAYLYLIALDKKKKELQQRIRILSEQN